MSRDITTATSNASKQPNVIVVTFVKLEYDSGDLNLNDTERTITFNGDDYLGAGNLGAISGIEEDNNLSPPKVKMTLSGIPTNSLAIALDEDYQGRPATIWLGFLDLTNFTLIADPTIIFSGKMDVQTINIGAAGTIELVCSNEIAQWNRVKVRRYNGTDQRLRFPNDRGLDYVTQAAEKTINWGRPS